jgi:hypothetical protein
MKTFAFFLLTFVLLISCSESSESSSEKTKVEVPENKVEENSQEEVVQTEEKVEPLKSVSKLKLICVLLGEDENYIPRSEVKLVIDYKNFDVGKCQACGEIKKEDYDRYGIPKSAFSACGGWFAGGGDYFYAVRIENEILIYSGWQDEGQMEDNDDSFHWKLTKSIPIE